jgi:hypothetical protein
MAYSFQDAKAPTRRSSTLRSAGSRACTMLMVDRWHNTGAV